MLDTTEPAELFDPRNYAGVRRPYHSAETLPAWCYTSERFYGRERERIFMKYWNCIGHNSRVPEAGSYITLRFCDVPLIVVRGPDMQVRAFINSCRHRGSEIMTGEGSCRVMKCPYHAWAFSLTGELVATPLFEDSEHFSKADFGLIPIKLEQWAGMMWINFDPDSSDLLTNLGDLPDRTSAWAPETMVCVDRRAYPVKANWKFYMENYSDGYHVPFVHQHTLNRKHVAKRDFHDPNVNIGNYLMHYTYFEGTRGVMGGQKKLPELDLPADKKGGSFLPLVHANTMMSFNIDMVRTTEVYPEGPGHCTLVTSTLVPQATADLPDFRETLDGYLKNSDIVRDEDVLASERQQLGVSSRLNRPGCFTPQDKLVHDYDLWILDQVVGNG
jgi:choline monooxygenase